MPKPAARKWVYTVPVPGGQMEAEVWTASTRRDEIKSTIALAHGVPMHEVKIRPA